MTGNSTDESADATLRTRIRTGDCIVCGESEAVGEIFVEVGSWGPSGRVPVCAAHYDEMEAVLDGR